MISHSVLCLMLIRARAQQSLQSVKPYVYTTLDWGYFNSYPTEKLLTAFCLSGCFATPTALHRIADVAEDIGPSQSTKSTKPQSQKLLSGGMLRLNEEKGAAAVSAMEVCP